MDYASKKVFLDRISDAVRAGNRFRHAPTDEDVSDAGFIGAGPDAVATLAAEIQKVGGQAVVVDTRTALDEAILAVVSRYRVRRALCNAGHLLEQLAVPATLESAGVEILTPEMLENSDESAKRDAVFAVDLGVAAPDWAIAETGSLLYASSSGQMRSTSLLPPVHVAVVDRRCILPDLMNLPTEIYGRRASGELPRNVALVTGPSKTGDIELRLTTGVHGPGELVVLVWNPTM